MMRIMSNQYIVNIVSAIIISVLFFLLKEFIYPVSKVDGYWKAEYIIDKTDYSKYKDMKVYVDIYLYQIGDKIYGTAEKMAEEVKGKEKYFYDSKYRVRMNLNGNINNYIFKTDELILHIVENGRKRKITNLIKLKIINENTLEGTFFSSASNTFGKALYKKKY